MPDREKTIEALDCIVNRCDYYKTLRDALALLKGREPVKPTYNEYGFPFCGACGRRLFCIDDNDKCCSKCGRKVQWDA